MHTPAYLQAVVLLIFGTGGVFSAVHHYHEDYFYAVADAYIFRGGREALFASSAEVSGPCVASMCLSHVHGCSLAANDAGSEEVGRFWAGCPRSCKWTV